MGVALKASLHHGGEVASVLTSFVDGNAEWCQARKVHQQVVDQITEVVVIVLADDRADGDAVNTTQGMVTHKRIATWIVFGRKVLQSFNLNFHIQEVNCGLEPRRAFQVARLPKMGVNLVLVNNMLEPPNQGTRNPTGLLSQFVFKNLVYVDNLLHQLLVMRFLTIFVN